LDFGMLLLGMILFGMLIGSAAQLIVGRSARNGLAFRPSGILGSLVGAIIVTLAWQWWRARRAEPKR